ncbi:hypothetical protein AB1Y20_014375 [Prymnesium parvum]|uniref:Selenoprotein O n=1 Tax=Prymnesium parvum TaxID=97485 RepID=A0AB34IES9_PRYPA
MSDNNPSTPTGRRLVGMAGPASDQAANKGSPSSPVPVHGETENVQHPRKGYRIGMSAFAMPIYDMSSTSVHERLIPAPGELATPVTTREFAQWLDLLPLYADHRSAEEPTNIHVNFHEFIKNKFPGMGLQEPTRFCGRHGTITGADRIW